MKKVIGIAALLLLLNPVFGFAQQRVGWIPDDVTISVLSLQTVDSLKIVATWESTNQFEEKFVWRIPELGTPNVETLARTDSMFVVRPNDDLNAQFCIKTVRLSDLKESGEECVDFVIPGVEVQPPTNINIEIQVAWSNVGSVKWDTVPGAHQYFPSLETDGGLLAVFGWNVYQRDAHCVGQQDHRPTGVLNYEGLEIIDVFT